MQGIWQRKCAMLIMRSGKRQMTEGIVKLVILVEGNPKAPFSIATSPRCSRGRYSIPWIASLPWILIL